MTQRVLALAFALGALAASPASPPRATPREHASMTRQLDQLCRWTGLRRITEPRITEGSQTKYRTKALLEVDGKRRPFTIEYCRERGELYFCGFYPDETALVQPEEGFRDFQYEKDTLRDSR